jgi:cyclopropane-fatty-acyl-phospholipid synthase
MENSVSTFVDTNSAGQISAQRGVWERLVCRWLTGVEKGRLTVRFPSGTQQTFQGISDGPAALIEIHDERLYTRLVGAGDTGFAESYMAGEWDTPDLAAVLAFGMANEAELGGALEKSWLMRALDRLRHAARSNTRRGSRRNIAQHYDLGNEFYQPWLDPSMTYSSALFADLEEPMETAQRRKYLRLAEMVDLKPGDRVLEIGCGWGGFAEIAAREFGCDVVGLTLSREQAAYARQRMARLGLSGQVEIRLQDYRDVAETFDKVVSIEMFEAVGEKYWPRFFATLDRCLVPGGRAGLQIITIDDTRFESYRRDPDFIQRYIFPGGMLPSPRAFEAAVNDGGFALREALFFGKSYAETLRRWDVAFGAAWPALSKLGFDERFRRMWHYYLRYCEAGFDHGAIDVGHFLIERP